MVSINGVNFGRQKLVKKALERFFGLGPQASARIMAKHSIYPLARLGTLPAKTITALTADLTNMTIENDARRIIRDNIFRLKNMGSYRGQRHATNLPVRGQRTQTQIETARKLNSMDRHPIQS